MDKPALDGLYPVPYLVAGSGFPNDAIGNLVLIEFRFHWARVGGLLFFRMSASSHTHSARFMVGL